MSARLRPTGNDQPGCPPFGTNGGFPKGRSLSSRVHVLAVEVGLPVHYQAQTGRLLLWRNGHQEALAVPGDVEHLATVQGKLLECLRLTQFKAFASRSDLHRNNPVVRIHVEEL